MMPSSTLTRTMNAVIEGCWLVAVAAIPLFFNVNSRRVFEPDKITVFRNIVIVMLIALIVKGIEAAPRLLARLQQRRGQPEGQATEPAATPAGGLRGLLRTYPLLAPIALFVVVYSAATARSIDPSISFWGSYERLQGTYTWFSYIVFFLVIVTHLRRWEQIERVVSAAIFASMPVALYGVLQHFHYEFLAWGGDVFTRVASTMGNAIFLGAYLLMVVPLTIYRIYMQVADLTQPAAPASQPQQPARGGRRNAEAAAPPAWQRRREQRHGMIMLAVYTVALLLQLFAILYTYSRGPFGGLVVALIAFGIIAGLRYRVYPLVAGCVFVLLLGVAVLGLANKKNPVIHSGSSGISRLFAVTSSESGTTEVRQLIWEGSRILIKERPILGWGPEIMLLAYNHVYPPALGHIEQANASPDRNHDELMDFLVMSGVLGLLAYLSILGTFFWLAFRLVWRLRGVRESMLVIALIAVVLGHIGEGLVGIGIISTLMMLWLCFALASVVYRLAPGFALAPALATAAATAAATPLGARGGRQGNQAARGTAGRPAVGQTRAAPASGSAWEHLSGGRMVAALGSTAAGMVAIVALIVLFLGNYQVVAADVVFKDALNYEQTALQAEQAGQQALQTQPTAAGGANTTATQNYQAALFYFNGAIDRFRQAISVQPNQDFYYLYLGKTLLELVRTDGEVYTKDTSARDRDIRTAEDVLHRAYNLNPQDTDHSANLGRMYQLWANWDATKWPLALQWFDKAVGLSPHHSRLFDEYGIAVRTYGQYLGNAGKDKKAQSIAMYRRARDLFKQATKIDSQLSDAYALWGDTEFSPIYLNNPVAAIGPYSMTASLLAPDAGNLPAIYSNMSFAYVKKKDYASAVTYGKKAMDVANTLLQRAATASNASPSDQGLRQAYSQAQNTYNQTVAIYNQALAKLRPKGK